MNNFLGQILPLLAASGAGQVGAPPQPVIDLGVGGDQPQRRQPGPALANYLGNTGQSSIQDAIGGVQQALERNRDLAAQQQWSQQAQGFAQQPRPEQPHKSRSIFRQYGPVSNFLGILGDALLVNSGKEPVYGPRMERHRVAEAMSQLGDGDNAEALRRIYEIDPRLGMAAEDQLYQRQTRKRESDYRIAAGDVLLGTDPAARERAIRADPGAYQTLQGNSETITQRQIDNHRKLNDLGMQILGGVHDQGSWDRARVAAAALNKRFGIGTESVDALPAEYDPAVVRDLQLKGMDTYKQLATVARENKLEWDQEDDRLDNERADDNAASLDRHRRNLDNKPGRAGGSRSPSGAPKSEQGLYTQLMTRWSRGEQLNPREREFIRSYNAQRDAKIKGKPKGGAAGGSATSDGAIIRNPKTGERMKLQGGKWVPIK